MKKNLKKILACTLALRTLCAVSSINVSADSEYVYTDEFIDFLLSCEPEQIISDNCYTVMIDVTYDENGNAVYKNKMSPVEVIEILGYKTNGDLISGNVNEKIIWIDENGIPKIIQSSYFGENREISCTIDFETGEEIILVWKEYLGNGKNNVVVSRCGDSNLDGNIDVRDVTTINQHIIKANILPDYTETVADVNNDENIDISDLGLLKQYILKMIDSF